MIDKKIEPLTRQKMEKYIGEVDEELLGNLREYALANSIYWALAEGHACEISARRNAMDVSSPQSFNFIFSSWIANPNVPCRTPPRTPVR